MRSPAPEPPGRRTWLLGLVVLALLAALAPAWAAPPEGTLVVGVHVTLVNRWLDPGDTEGLITPFMVLYPLHDALVKPMPGGINTPSLAESWSLARTTSPTSSSCAKASSSTTASR